MLGVKIFESVLNILGKYKVDEYKMGSIKCIGKETNGSIDKSEYLWTCNRAKEDCSKDRFDKIDLDG